MVALWSVEPLDWVRFPAQLLFNVLGWQNLANAPDSKEKLEGDTRAPQLPRNLVFRKENVGSNPAPSAINRSSID